LQICAKCGASDFFKIFAFYPHYFYDNQLVTTVSFNNLKCNKMNDAISKTTLYDMLTMVTSSGGNLEKLLKETEKPRSKI